MAMEGLFALLCAISVPVANPDSPATADPVPSARIEPTIASTLAVQSAMQQGRDLLLKGDHRASVSVLESQLANINGNQAYLKILQTAYRGYIQELRLAKREDEAQKIIRLLAILDKGPSSEQAPHPPITARAKSEDDPPAESSSQAADLLGRAEKEFGQRHYREASALFAAAYQAEPGSVAAAKERWAYCKLYSVVEQINGGVTKDLSWQKLDAEARAALELAPKLEYARFVLQEIERRRGSTLDGPSKREFAVSAVRHYPRDAGGWYLAESANFRVYHTQAQDYAERVVGIAERTRDQMMQKWFGGASETWALKCDLFLHATNLDYSRTTGQQGSPGHSTIRMEAGRVVVRRIDLHCDDPNIFHAILPHETTHVVLAGAFGEQLPPRWADEGMAVLSEPREKIERHLRHLDRCRQDGLLFHTRDLIEQTFQPQHEGYPEPRRIGAFYAQSVSLVDFLSRQRGPQTFSLFLMDGMRYGYEKSLKRHFGYSGFSELEQRWSEESFSDVRAVKAANESH